MSSLIQAIALQPDYPEAQFNLAQLYDAGRGVSEDNAEAARLYRSAAEQGQVGAQVNLGRMYRDGRGVARDDSEAVRWYRQAADEGHPFAQYNLGRMYEEGDGVVQDDVAAHMWYGVAASRLTSDVQNAGSAARTLALESQEQVEQRMRPEEIVEAVRRAQEWKPVDQQR